MPFGFGGAVAARPATESQLKRFRCTACDVQGVEEDCWLCGAPCDGFTLMWGSPQTVEYTSYVEPEEPCDCFQCVGMPALSRV